jgi:lipid A ethanolaminephosphotransferase
MFLRGFRPMMRVETVVLIVIAWMVAVLNGSWWTAAGAGRDWTSLSTWSFLCSTFVALVALHFALIAPLIGRWTARPLLTVIVIASAAAAYYMREYSVLLDPAMIQNILKTDTYEAKDLLSWSMVGYVLLGSALPVAFIWLVRLERRGWIGASLVRVGSVFGAVVIAVLAILPVNRDLTSLMRNQRELRYLITPGNFVYGLVARSASDARDAGVSRAPVGTDARMIRAAGTDKPRVFVLVVGETARAANFSMMGYERATNPELAGLDVVAFRDVRSCGTSTEISVPCMFSPYGRADYDERRIRNSEGLLDVLARAGYAVQWIDNQSGCKGVCQGAGIEYRKSCPAGECFDGVLVSELDRELDNMSRDTVIVLHMMGNHGPAYFKRYPQEFRRFTPACGTAELRRCTRAEVVNAYDNAILYTDHVLASIVSSLQRRSSSLDAAMLYLSDHGESLGEAGLYLHGLPYAIAPETQKRVPMIAWLSPQFANAVGVDRECLLGKVDEPLSHDNLFHSVIGVLDVHTRVYRAGRDVFEGCRVPPGAGYARSAAR